MIACSLLTPAGAAHVPGATPHTSLIVALFSAAFAMGAWARAGLYCNHQVLALVLDPADFYFLAAHASRTHMKCAARGDDQVSPFLTVRV